MNKSSTHSTSRHAGGILQSVARTSREGPAHDRGLRVDEDLPPAGRRELTAVAGVSFHVAAGEVYGLLGPNGAGKTTTLRMLLGLLSPTQGQAEVAGFRSDQSPDEVKRRVGLVAAGAGLYQYLTAREMLLFF